MAAELPAPDADADDEPDPEAEPVSDAAELVAADGLATELDDELLDELDELDDEAVLSSEPQALSTRTPAARAAVAAHRVIFTLGSSRGCKVRPARAGPPRCGVTRTLGSPGGASAPRR
ncbi:hypothetical protein GCM10011594_39580 [Nakamurella endophytica]|uniref:Uncharacterized protein n=1 Tax=Nakamurella endophytica TaxID=1748367 RepID=A0A917WML7_9ACTN|nr:hypothetical protein GCM10011594_39580 [Nakamurella endophytica]